ncbi:hypothetical protein LENED_006941 [Lentinula edodes]|uniref:Uncharacterized protein n=1 Tax=Lentinula edodes TaxID=5353 RepID=A0A1Q3ED24_LENED|nr:hypothetical protein LENED_006941 [Lentinula edodes]
MWLFWTGGAAATSNIFQGVGSCLQFQAYNCNGGADPFDCALWALVSFYVTPYSTRVAHTINIVPTSTTYLRSLSFDVQLKIQFY